LTAADSVSLQVYTDVNASCNHDVEVKQQLFKYGFAPTEQRFDARSIQCLQV